MNVIDGAVSLVVAVAAAGGVRRGFLAQVSATASIAGGLSAARALGPPVAAGFSIDRYVAYLAVFGPSALALRISLRRLARRVREGPLAPLDRALGGALGAAKGVLVCYFLLYVVLCFPAGAPPLSRSLARAFEAVSEALPRSVAIPLFIRGMDPAGAFFPPEFRVRLDEKGPRKEQDQEPPERERGRREPPAAPVREKPGEGAAPSKGEAARARPARAPAAASRGPCGCFKARRSPAQSRTARGPRCCGCRACA